MKKLVLTIAIVLGMSAASFAEYGGGLFQRGVLDEEYYGLGYFEWERDNLNKPLFPLHDENTNQNAPLGGGVAIMLGLGTAYLLGKKRREE